MHWPFGELGDKFLCASTLHGLGDSCTLSCIITGWPGKWVSWQRDEVPRQDTASSVSTFVYKEWGSNGRQCNKKDHKTCHWIYLCMFWGRKNGFSCKKHQCFTKHQSSDGRNPQPLLLHKLVVLRPICIASNSRHSSGSFARLSIHLKG